MNNKNRAIVGEGGKGGGGGRTAQEGPNTLRSAAVVRVLEVLSEGEIVGIAGGAQGIYINDTPLLNSSDVYNFARVTWDIRTGLPSQQYMPGFPSVENEITINTTIVKGTGTVPNPEIPASRTTTDGAVDSILLTIGLPQGLYEQNKENGDITGSKVEFTVEHKRTSSGAWLPGWAFAIEGKTTSAYERQYPIAAPPGSGTWDFRVRRTTDDSTSSAIRNTIALNRITEIQDVKLSYDDTAYIGIAIDAESVGSSIPKRSYLVKGLKIKVPSNYNPVTRAYSGTWNGTFQIVYSDNPAWVLYDLLTHPRYGMGAFVPESAVDKFSFYNAAVYNDQQVRTGKADNSTEPRFTFNTSIASREEAFRVLQMVAGAMRGSLIYINGLVTLLQDRPADPVAIVNNASVIDGKFTYRSTGLFERATAANVTYNNRDDRHLQHITTAVPPASWVPPDNQMYSEYIPIDIAAYGASTEGQAKRHGLWALFTSLKQTEVVQFKMFLNGFTLLPGDIVKIYDEDYTNVAGSGRIVSVAGTLVTIDRPVVIGTGATIEVLLADGKSLQTKNITNTNSVRTSFTISSGFSQTVPPGSVYIVNTAVFPRQFRIIGIKQEEDNTVVIEAVNHEPGKYAAVEDGVEIGDNPYSGGGGGVGGPKPVTNITFAIETLKNADGTLVRYLAVSWAEISSSGSSYRILWSRDSNNSKEEKAFTNSVKLPIDSEGKYRVTIFTVDATGRSSTGTTAEYDVSFVIPGAVGYTVQNIRVKGLNGLIFETDDFTVIWDDAYSNPGPVKNYKVEVKSSGGTVLRTTVVTDREYTYTEVMNREDGGLRGVLIFAITPRDLNGSDGNTTEATIVNLPPAHVDNFNLIAGIQNVKLTWDYNPEPDVSGYLVWRSTSANFTPSAANVVYDGPSNYVSDPILD